MRRHISNWSWMVSEGVLGALLNIIILSFVARVLGPEQYGMYAYVFALAALFASFGYLGLDAVVVRDLVKAPPEQHGEILGTAMLLRISAYSFAALSLLTYGLLQPTHSSVEVALLITAGVFLVSQPATSLPILWFRARSDLRTPSGSNLLVALAGGLLKIAVLAAGLGVVALGASQALAGIMASIFLMLMFLRKGGVALKGWSVSRTRAVAMLRESWRLQVSGLLAALYLQIDIPLLRLLAGPEEAGQYAFAARLVVMTGVFAVAVATTAYPSMIQAHGKGRDAEDRLLRLCFSILTLGAYIIVAVELAVGDQVVRLVIGERFDGSGASLSVLILTLPLAFSRPIISQWAVLNGRSSFLIWSEGLGALTVIGLNLALVPILGSFGSALAMLSAFVVASVVPKLCTSDTRRLLALQVLSLIDPVSPIYRFIAERRRDI